MEVMSVDEPIWEDHHQISFFLPNSNSTDPDFVALISYDIVKNPQTPILLRVIDSKVKLCNITKKIPIDILVKPKTIEHVHIG